MAITFYDLVRVSVASAPGTGSITLGPAISGFLTFAQAAVPNGAQVVYAINDSSQSEIGLGTYNSGTNTLSRDTVYSSTNGGPGGSKINASVFAQVFLTFAAENFVSYTNVTTLAALKALQGGYFNVVVMESYSILGDGGGGTFVWDSTSVAADNGGTIIQPNAGGTGRWLRIVPEPGRHHVNWFGAKGDNSTDNASAIAATKASLASGGDILFSYGTYLCSTAAVNFVNGSGYNYIGVGSDDIAQVTKLILTSASALDSLIILDGAQSISFINLNLQCNNAAYTGTLIKMRQVSGGQGTSFINFYNCRIGGINNTVVGATLFDVGNTLFCSFNDCFVSNGNVGFLGAHTIGDYSGNMMFRRVWFDNRLNIPVVAGGAYWTFDSCVFEPPTAVAGQARAMCTTAIGMTNLTIWGCNFPDGSAASGYWIDFLDDFGYGVAPVYVLTIGGGTTFQNNQFPIMNLSNANHVSLDGIYFYMPSILTSPIAGGASMSNVNARNIRIYSSSGEGVGTIFDAIPGGNSILDNNDGNGIRITPRLTTAATYGGTAAGSTLVVNGTSNGAPANAYLNLQSNGQFVSIGNTSPRTYLDVNANLTSSPAHLVSTSMVSVQQADGLNSGYEVMSYGAGTWGGNIFASGIAAGTSAAPTPPLANQYMFNMRGYGYNSGWQLGAVILVLTAEGWSAGHQGTVVDIYTTPIASTTMAQAARFQASGGFSVGTTADPGIGSLQLAGFFASKTPTTYTGTSGTISATDSSAIFNASGTFTATLPAAASYPGRWLHCKNIAAQTVNSATANVVPLAGGAAGTALLSNIAGKWCMLQSDGTNWVMMAGG